MCLFHRESEAEWCTYEGIRYDATQLISKFCGWKKFSVLVPAGERGSNPLQLVYQVVGNAGYRTPPPRKPRRIRPMKPYWTLLHR